MQEALLPKSRRKFSFGNSQEAPSPFGIEEDYFMNSDKAKRAGFQIAVLEEWMPLLISELAEPHLSN